MLENVKPGDKLLVIRAHLAGASWAYTVKRVTKTMIILRNGQRFRRKDGLEVGCKYECDVIKPLNYEHGIKRLAI